MLTKKDLIEIIAKQEGTSKKEAKHIIDAFAAGIKTVLKDHKSVNVTGFAKFESKFKDTYSRVMGITGEMIEIPAHYIHKAKLSKTIAD